jgi:excisionase family DNA binding protein
MDQLLTVKDVQDLLQVDRITVYRMLKDGRLTGIKIGTQWRFSRDEIESLVSLGGHPDPHTAAPLAAQVLPLHCVQMIQDVFAEVAGVSAVTTTAQGAPLTSFSQSCRFCQLILDSPMGRQGCQATWQRLATQGGTPGEFVTCHAGLQSIGATITVDDAPVATIIAGQFYAAPPAPTEEAARVQALAAQCGIDPQALREAAATVPVLDTRKREQLPGWLASVAHTFAVISRERAMLMSRLRSIAAMSSLD